MIRVLYVDDEESLLELAKEFLEVSDGIVLETATTAKQGLKRVLEGDIEVVVSDYMMPEMDGLEFLRALRDSGNDVPFILFTGKGREEVVIQALNEGADSYLQKGGHPRPQFAELAHRINRAVERRRVVQALQQSEARLKRAEEIAGFGHWELHLDSRMMVASSGAKIIYGTAEEVFTYEVAKKIPLPEYRSMLDRALADLIGKGSIYDLEFKAKRPSDGRIVTVHSRAEYDPFHRIVFGVLQDITERRRAEMELFRKNEELVASYAQMSSAEEELRSAQHKLAVAMDLAKLVYWDLDIIRGMFIFNDQFYSLYGTTTEREGGYLMAPAVYVDRFVHPDDQALVNKAIDVNLNSTMGINQLEHRIVRRDGSVRDFIVCVEVERDSSGRPVRIYGANQDVTDHKKAELALERANSKLSLLNSITRHDITNQLTILLGNLEIVKGSAVDQKTLSSLDKIERSGRIILDQIRFTKEYQDMGSSAPQWQDVGSIVRRNPLAREIRDLQISEDVDRFAVYADPMLPKVFNNLIENSLRYGAAPPQVRISSVPDGEGVMLIFEDEGPGIPDGEKERIFEKGFGKGTGLGLFLSREILAITGITIRETGIPGKGVRFEISIPTQMVRV